MDLNYNNKISYTGRCRQIKDADWVRHVVRSVYPHISSTRFSAPIYKLRMQNPDLYRKAVGKTFNSLAGSVSPEQLKIASIFNWQHRAIQKFLQVREFWGCGLNNILKQFKYDKFGNCGEDAYVAASVLKLNGIENAYVAGLNLNGERLDHAVCVFNRDGTPFKGIAGKNTIIIDPWLDAADFASNMFLKYKNLCKKFFFKIDENSEIGFRNIKKIDISGEEQFLLLLRYKELKYPSYEREFMH